jgi:hypothetical protein
MHLIVAVVNLLARMRSRIVELRAAGQILIDESELAAGVPGPITDSQRATLERSFGLAPMRLGIRRLPFGRLVVLDPAHLHGAVQELRESVGGHGGTRAVLDHGEQDPRLGLAAAIRLLETERASLTSQGGKLFLHCPMLVSAERDTDLPSAARVEWTFHGDGDTVFASLSTRMSHAPLFNRVRSWKSGGLWTANTGGRCAVEFERTDSEVRLTLSFDLTAAGGARPYFEQYVQARLEKLVDPSTVRRRVVFICAECDTLVSREQVRKRRERGLDWLPCNVCGARIVLRDDGLSHGQKRDIAAELDKGAGIARRRDIATLVLIGKRLTADYDTYIAHAAADRDAVVRIAGWVEDRGILPWLHGWEQAEMEPGVERKVRVALVFVGRDIELAWEDPRTLAVLEALTARKVPVVRVDLPGRRRNPTFPDWLTPVATVDFSVADPNPVEELSHWISGWHRDTIQ